MRSFISRLLPFALALFVLALLPSGIAFASEASAKFKSAHPITLEIDRQLVMDSKGNAHILQFSQPTGNLTYLTIPKGKSPTAAVTLVPSQPGNSNAEFVLAIDGSNRLHIVWTTQDGAIHYQTRTSNGTLSAALTAGQQGTDVYSARLAVEPSGRAHIAWTDASGQGQVVRITNGQLGAVKSIGEGRIARIAADAAGTLHFTYLKAKPNTVEDGIYYATMTLNGTLSAVLELGFREDNGAVNNPFQLLVTPDGATHMLLETYDDSDDPGTAAYLLIRANGTSTRAELGKYFGRTKGVLDSKGRIHIALIAAVLRTTNNPPYPTYDQELRYLIYKNGAFEKSSIYAKVPEGISDIAMAMGPDDKSTTIWQQRQPNGSDAVIARRPGSTTPRTIFSAPPSGFGLALATAPDGGAVALWGAGDGTTNWYASTYE